MSLIACETVTSAHCAASERERGDGIRGLRCYRCGLGTCADCSSIQTGPIVRAGRVVQGRPRLCDSCLEQEPDGEARVLLRRYHEAGYPDRTLDQTLAEVAANERTNRRFFSSVLSV